MNYAVITENDESQWDDKTGVQYHFPRKYKDILVTGTKVIYYKGAMKDKKYEESRLSKKPHYFGIAEIGKVKTTNSKDYFAEITNYASFNDPIDFKKNGNYLETVSENKKLNYFRDGVRQISKSNYDTILLEIALEIGKLDKKELILNQPFDDELSTVFFEGEKKVVYSTKYERDSKARIEAIRIHGTTCMVCGINFEKKYGEIGKGFIHVHHVKPISTVKEKSKIDPKKDLVVVCPNCHSMIHRKRSVILTVSELKKKLKKI